MAYVIAATRPDDPALRAFIDSWGPEDRALRFGSSSEAAAAWLVRALDAGRNDAVIASGDDGIVGVLDFTARGACTEFGVFVAPGARRRGIGRALVERLLARTPEGLVADCRCENAAAVGLLRSLRFELAERNGNEIRWTRRRGLECPRRPGSPSS